ncbi:MAG: hypothetical protein IPP15_05885 [Saprospiraceae bacterium]|uniref:Uncharacterized protein n=1 Tax=Candidatus Opimibacter skivensis TaxID=2982028 RepID=A0A9D7SRH5_9BACT|nr:hypothetical protein [Candidatus Opimibacter skivensis]
MERKALTPLAVLFEPDTFDNKENTPIAVLLIPVVFDKSALSPSVPAGGI